MSDSSPNLLYQHRFAVIDQFQFIDAVKEGAFDELRPVTLVPRGMEGDAEKLPLCVNLAALPDDVCERWWTKSETARLRGEPAIFGALLEASVPPPEMQAHLVQSLICYGGAKPRKFLLRFYDPRVFAHLVWILKPEQRSLLLGPIHRWTWCHEGQWQMLDNPKTLNKKTSLLTSKLQWQQIERIAQYNRVREHAGKVDTTTLSDQAALIDILFTRAREMHGLVDEQDQVLFAVHGLCYHPCFDQHPRLARLFKELKLAEANYRDAAALIRPDEWQQITQDLQQSRPYVRASLTTSPF